MFQALLHKADTTLKDQRPFVLYRKPREAQVTGIFQKDDGLHLLTDFRESGFVFAPFQSDAPTLCLQPDIVLHTESPRPTPTKNRTVAEAFDPGPGQEHQMLVRRAINAMGESDLQKVVLSTCFQVPLAQGPLAIFEQLLALYAEAFCYLWYHPSIGLWLGATPEILVSVRGSRLTTMSLAGTLPLVAGKEPNWTTKEIAEQNMVTGYIKQVLKERMTDLQTGPLETVQAGSLWHLRTRLFGTHAPQDLGTIVQALHPTPAVCGLPAGAAKAFLDGHEGYPREFYTGYLGELNLTVEKAPHATRRNTEHKAYRSRMNTTNLYVNLRCMQIKDDRAYIYVGGGITAASDPALEWQELCQKSRTILNALG
jgi:isochorismate synthase